MSKTRKTPLRLVFDKCPTCDPSSKAYLNSGRDWAMKHGTFAMIVPPGSSLRGELTRQHRLQPPFAEYDGHAAKDMNQL